MQKLTLVAAAVVLVTGCSTSAQQTRRPAPNEVVATVGSSNITLAEVDDSRYFLIHHTPADTIDKIDPVEMARCAAAVTVMAYVVADLPERLGE